MKPRGSVVQKLPRRFRNQILLYFLLLSSPPLLIWGFFAFAGSSQMVAGFLENEIRYKTEEVAAKIENAKTLNATFARYIALELKDRARSDWQEVVRNISLAEPDLYNIHIIDPLGNHIVRSDSIAPKAFNDQDRKYFREAMAGQISHEVVWSREYNRLALCTGQKLDSKNLVVTVCRYDENFWSNIRRIHLGRTGYLFLLNERNEVLIHPSLPFLSTEFSPVDAAAVKSSSLGQLQFDWIVDGEAHRGFLLPLTGNWRLIAVHDRSELFSWAYEYLYWPSVSGVLSWMLMVVLTFFAVDRSTLPLAKLTLATRNLGPHNLQEKVHVESRDEMGLLAESFNEMTDRLQVAFASLAEKENELQKSKEGLENLVLEQSQKLLYSTKMSSLGEMAGGIAHEVNNPLAIISMRAQRLREQVEQGQLDQKQILETLEKIEMTCLRINQIIRGLRAFSRNGSLDPFVLENLSSILWEAVSLCSEAMRNRGIDLQVHCEAEIEVECQPVQLGQVVLNLLTNAKDAVSDGKERWIRIDAKYVNEKFVEVSVTDSGQGTGLGLSVSKGIIQQHGGELSLNEDAPNTQFVIRLPLLQKYRNQ